MFLVVVSFVCRFLCLLFCLFDVLLVLHVVGLSFPLFAVFIGLLSVIVYFVLFVVGCFCCCCLLMFNRLFCPEQLVVSRACKILLQLTYLASALAGLA